MSAKLDETEVSKGYFKDSKYARIGKISHEKQTKAYELFEDGKSVDDVAAAIGIKEHQADWLFNRRFLAIKAVREIKDYKNASIRSMSRDTGLPESAVYGALKVLCDRAPKRFAKNVQKIIPGPELSKLESDKISEYRTMYEDEPDLYFSGSKIARRFRRKVEDALKRGIDPINIGSILKCADEIGPVVEYDMLTLKAVEAVPNVNEMSYKAIGEAIGRNAHAVGRMLTYKYGSRVVAEDIQNEAKSGEAKPTANIKGKTRPGRTKDLILARLARKDVALEDDFVLSNNGNKISPFEIIKREIMKLSKRDLLKVEVLAEMLQEG